MLYIRVKFVEVKKKNMPIEDLDPKDYILIKGAKTHNLKNIDVAIPRNKLVVISGLSGSGKSSLAFDTLYAEGQRRYIESLSAYARQFLGRLEKPPVEYIKGISPGIAIEQKVISRNPRSTVGTITEIYDYLKLLFARIGKTYSPVSGKEVKRHQVKDVLEEIFNQNEGCTVLVCARIKIKKEKSLSEQLQLYSQQGFTRILVDREICKLSETDLKKIKSTKEIFLLIDRIVVSKSDDELVSRAADSIETAFFEGNGTCEIFFEKGNTYAQVHFSNLFEADGIRFEEPVLNFFSFNNPIGACKHCEGFGSIIGIDPDLVIPNKSLSVYENAIACWNGETMSWYKNQLIKNAHKFNFPIHKPVVELAKTQYNLLWKGNNFFEGIEGFFKQLERESYKIQYRVMLARYRGKTQCPECRGTRLRKDADYVKVNGASISDLVLMPIDELAVFFDSLNLSLNDEKTGKRLLTEIKSRIRYLMNVGLSYLTLNRVANTLSGGESQRINLATSLGSSLVGSMYILDEPSIGLHSRDTDRLIKVMKDLKSIGNTVIIVEHDEEIIKQADHVIDIGPMAGSMGGNLVFSGNLKELSKEKNCLTADYLNGIKGIPVPDKVRNWNTHIELKNVNENNLKNIQVKIPLNVFCVITGVSGSGKSTLIKKVLIPRMNKYLEGYFDKIDSGHLLGGSLKAIKQLEYIDQNPIGKSSRSNPVTYIKAYDEIRALFAEQNLAKLKGFKPSQFSFNVDGGRCEVCEGEGVINVEMQFMADVKLQCEQCKGKRFKEETLEILFHGYNVADILEMTIDDAVKFFQTKSEQKICKKIVEKLSVLQEVGLGYVQLGQSSSTLSGGEAQRIKLASFLVGGVNAQATLFIFDEPTTGLHFHDIQKLMKSFDALLKRGNSIVVIEHNLDVIKCADWVIDLGPEGGEKGGEIIFEGRPQELLTCKKSYTGNYLKEKLKK